MTIRSGPFLSVVWVLGVSIVLGPRAYAEDPCADDVKQLCPEVKPGSARVVGCLTKDGSDWVLTKATAPERTDKTGVGPTDATRPLGTKSMTLKFVLTKLDSYVGQRMSVSGMLIGAGGADGINVTTVNRVAENCP